MLHKIRDTPNTKIYLCYLYLLLILICYGLIVKALVTHQPIFEVAFQVSDELETNYLIFVATFIMLLGSMVNHLADLIYSIFDTPRPFKYLLTSVGTLIILAASWVAWLYYSFEATSSFVRFFSLTLLFNIQFWADVLVDIFSVKAKHKIFNLVAAVKGFLLIVPLLLY